MRAWERRSGVLYATLSIDERRAANAEINEMQAAQQLDAPPAAKYGAHDFEESNVLLPGIQGAAEAMVHERGGGADDEGSPATCCTPHIECAALGSARRVQS